MEQCNKSFDYDSLEHELTPPLHDFMRFLLDVSTASWFFVCSLVGGMKFIDPTFLPTTTVVLSLIGATLAYAFVWWLHIMLYPYDFVKRDKPEE